MSACECVTEPRTAEAAEVAPAKSVDDQLIEELVGRAQAEGLQLTKRLESALKGEITDHLGYGKNDPAGKMAATPATESEARPCSEASERM